MSLRPADDLPTRSLTPAPDMWTIPAMTSARLEPLSNPLPADQWSDFKDPENPLMVSGIRRRVMLPPMARAHRLKAMRCCELIPNGSPGQFDCCDCPD